MPIPAWILTASEDEARSRLLAWVEKKRETARALHIDLDPNAYSFAEIAAALGCVAASRPPSPIRPDGSLYDALQQLAVEEVLGTGFHPITNEQRWFIRPEKER